MKTKKLLILDDCNMFEGRDPIAWLIELPEDITLKKLDELESLQPGRGSSGGNWGRIMIDGNIEYKELSKGRKSDYNLEEQEVFKVTSGNY